MPIIIGTEKAQGYSSKTIVIVSGAKAANVNIPLPAWAKGAQDLLQLAVMAGSDGTAVAVATEYTINPFGTETNAAGEASLYDEDNIRVGDALTTRDIIICTLIYKSFRVAV